MEGERGIDRDEKTGRSVAVAYEQLAVSGSVSTSTTGTGANTSTSITNRNRLFQYIPSTEHSGPFFACPLRRLRDE